MKAMELSRRYYEKYCAPRLRAEFPDLVGRTAAGLVGEGSECFGFDDEISRDHDWGAAICLWLDAEDYKNSGDALQKVLDGIARDASEIPLRHESPMAAGRSGVLEIGEFYFKHIGFAEGPKTLFDWMRIPEERLATVTNGAVFTDPYGKFTATRNNLLNFYPEDVRRKKLACRLAVMAQAGQYNLPRCLKRKEMVAARLAEAQFINSSVSAVFLLNRRYVPFYKWAHRALRQLPMLGGELAALLDELVVVNDPGKEELVEKSCVLVAEEIWRQGLSDETDLFLLAQAIAVQNSIEDDTLRGLSVFVG